MKRRDSISKREMFFRRIIALIGLGIVIYIFQFKIKKAVGLFFVADWLPIVLFFVVLYELIKDIKLKNWKKDSI